MIHRGRRAIQKPSMLPRAELASAVPSAICSLMPRRVLQRSWPIPTTLRALRPISGKPYPTWWLSDLPRSRRKPGLKVTGWYQGLSPSLKPPRIALRPTTATSAPASRRRGTFFAFIPITRGAPCVGGAPRPRGEDGLRRAPLEPRRLTSGSSATCHLKIAPTSFPTRGVRSWPAARGSS